MDDLRKYAPVRHLIIPGWLDRMSMREIANNGYSEHVELILFPFEQRWLRATLDANRKWERNVCQDEPDFVGLFIKRWFRHVASLQSVSGTPAANMPGADASSKGGSSCLFPFTCSWRRGNLSKTGAVWG
jgi:hypothetical protein